MNRSKLLGEEKVSKLLLKFSVPAIVGMLVNAMYNIVDRIFVGRGIGSVGIAAITIGYPIMLIRMAFAMLIGLGATSLISIRLGEKKQEEAEKILGNAVILLLAISVIFTVVGLLFLNPLLRLFGASDTILPHAREYLSVILIGVIFSNIGFGMNNLIRAEGNPKIAMMTMLIGAITNIILDPIFIFVLRMGVRGAAIATILAQLISAAWVLFYYFSGKSLLKIRTSNFKLKKDIVERIMAIGAAPFARQVAGGGVVALLNNTLLRYGGDMAISAMGIINSVAMLIFMPIFGINQGAQPIIGFNYGARKYNRVSEAFKLAAMAATIVMTIGFIVTQLYPTQIIGIFTKDDIALIEMGSSGLRIYLAMLPLIGFQIIGSGYFQAVGKPKQSMFLSLSRQVTLLIPAILILPRIYGLTGAWISAPAADVGATLITGAFVYRELVQLRRQHDLATREPATID